MCLSASIEAATKSTLHTRAAHGSRNLFAICFIVLLNLQHIHNHDASVIQAHTHSADPHHRCSHVPPNPEQIRHVWLDGANFTTTQSDYIEDETQPQGDDHNYRNGRQAISKRHIESGTRSRGTEGLTLGLNTSNTANNSDDPSMNNTTSIRDTLWNLIKKLEKSTNSSLPAQPSHQKPESPNDLVPMRIQVYYDTSVHELEKKKLDLINNTVIPSVVNFFENALSIKRKYTIERFRIARRCPNNTMYYPRDPLGLSASSRPYCMDRCEDQAICGEMVVPREHLSACSYCNRTSHRCATDYLSEGEGVANTQLLLYVSARQTARCKKDQTIAYAAHCAQDTKTDRPVAGHANLCPMSISTDPKDLRGLISTVKHELTHVLGFSVSLFAYYRDAHGRPLLDRLESLSLSSSSPGPIPLDPVTGYAKWSDRVIKKVVRRNWLTGGGLIDKEVHMMVTPTVVREVRRHFNCSTLEGAELEDQGSDGTSMTHFEKRLFENEAMTGTHTQNSKYSRITLAVLQDTGWYVANFSQADRLDWGKDLGCDFATKSCKSWIEERRSQGQSIRPYCDRIRGETLQIACTDDRASKAVCNLRRYKTPLPDLYQNFGQPPEGLEGMVGDAQLAYYGGSVDLADYCPFIQEFSWQAHNVTSRGSRCDYGINTVESEKNAALEYYGPTSRCFEHGRRWEQHTCQLARQWHHYGAGCYRYSCTNQHYNVIVGNNSYPCYYENQMIQVEHMVDGWLYNGSIVCATCDKICPDNKCQTYNKRIIDLILDHAHSGDLGDLDSDISRKENSLRLILDEAYNMIDKDAEDELTFDNLTLTKYFLVLEEVGKLNVPRKDSDKPSLMTKLKDEASFMFIFPFPRHSHTRHDNGRLMVCSDARSIHVLDYSCIQLILLLATVSLLARVGSNASFRYLLNY